MCPHQVINILTPMQSLLPNLGQHFGGPTQFRPWVRGLDALVESYCIWGEGLYS
jgi:hypothetical protein